MTNDSLGIEFFGLSDSSGSNVISGISFYVTGNEPAGYAIDNLTFGSAREVVGTIPEPGSLLALCGLLVSGLTLRTRR